MVGVAVVNETFVTGIDQTTGAVTTQTLNMPKGPFLRLTGSLAVTVDIGDGSSAPFVLSGNFTFEQITLAETARAASSSRRTASPARCA
jgi:hypothetical protein